MKRILIGVTIAAVAVACNQTPKTANQQTTPTVMPDTTGLAQYQAWKAQNELSNTTSYNANQQAPTTKTITKVVHVYERPRHHYSSYSSGRMTSTSSNTAMVHRRGWSKAAKGSVIGGVTGGVIGAVISKHNRVGGGVIGAVLGAGGGYLIGRHQDKKDGRY